MKENKIRIIGVLILIIVILIIANHFTVNKNFHERMLEQRKEDSYSGIILKKYIDETQHSTPMLVLTNEKIISLENTFWNQVNVGDSIVKNKNDTFITLYKNNKLTAKFDYNQYFKDIN